MEMSTRICLEKEELEHCNSYVFLKTFKNFVTEYANRDHSLRDLLDSVILFERDPTVQRN